MSEVPSSGIWYWHFAGGGVVGGFTWRGAGDVNNFRLPEDPIDEPEAWAGMRDRLGASSIVVGEQVHGRRVFSLTSGPRRGWLVVPECDGLVTPTAGMALVARAADCVPMLLWVEGAAVGAIHAGWHGLAEGIVAAAVGRLMRLGHRAGDIFAAIGPAVGPCCYEIKEDVAGKLSALPGSEDAVVRRGGKSWYADLPLLARAQLAATGLRAAHILQPSVCTICNGDMFFSHRREGEGAGRQIGVIMLEAAD